MTEAHRRRFLQQAGAGAASLAAAQLANFAAADDKDGKSSQTNPEQPDKPGQAADKLVMGWIGCGGQATNLMKSFVAQPDVAVTYVCDPETARAGHGAGRAERVGQGAENHRRHARAAR